MTTATSKPEAGREITTEKERWLRAYRQMVSIRLFEEQVNEVYTRALMPGLAHLYSGEEAVAVGICEALRIDDYITSTHRGHGHCLAKGASPDRMFAELLGKEAGYCRGKGGSMHIADPATGNLGANAIVGGSVGIATGAAFSAKTLGTDRVAVCFFGEGALGQGSLYEVMNLAQLWKLPVIYVCENNQYATEVPFENEQRALGKDGKYRWFLIRYNPLLDEDGKIVRWYASATDAATDAGLWVHHELVSPTDGDAYSHGWIAGFPRDASPWVSSQNQSSDAPTDITSTT